MSVQPTMVVCDAFMDKFTKGKTKLNVFIPGLNNQTSVETSGTYEINNNEEYVQSVKSIVIQSILSQTQQGIDYTPTMEGKHQTKILRFLSDLDTYESMEKVKLEFEMMIPTGYSIMEYSDPIGSPDIILSSMTEKITQFIKYNYDTKTRFSSVHDDFYEQMLRICATNPKLRHIVSVYPHLPVVKNLDADTIAVINSLYFDEVSNAFVAVGPFSAEFDIPKIMLFAENWGVTQDFLNYWFR